MEIVKHSTCNSTLTVGVSQAAAGVVPLPVNRSRVDGVPMVQSFWRPDAVELEALNNGHPIMLEVYGETHAPLRVSVAGDKE